MHGLLGKGSVLVAVSQEDKGLSKNSRDTAGKWRCVQLRSCLEHLRKGKREKDE